MDNPVGTPVEVGLSLKKETDEEQVDPTHYRSIVRCLRYLCNTRLDLNFNVGLVSRFMQEPRKSHLLVAKRILRYVQGTVDFGILLPKGEVVVELELVGYSDSNWCGDKQDRKALQGALISWSSTKELVVALSSCEFEYIAASEIACQAMWLDALLGELFEEDNKSVIDLARHPASHRRSKHIETRFYFLREQVSSKKLKIEHCRTEIQFANIFTKALKWEKFRCLRDSIGINGVVAIDQFLPKEVTAQDQETGICTVSQFPTQAVQMISDMPSQFSSQSQTLRSMENKNVGCGVDNHETNFKLPSIYSKKARLVEEPCLSNKIPLASNSGIHAYDKNFSADNVLIDSGEVSHAVPDVAAAIEDLLEQTSKMHDQRSPAQTGCERSIYPSDRTVLGEDNSNPHAVFGLSKHWLNRKDDNGDASQERRAGIYDGFSETQTESQVVSYEEDLSGRQMLIDRVRTR
ncbi:Copia protein, partial [Mucuna pruriens]